MDSVATRAGEKTSNSESCICKQHDGTNDNDANYLYINLWIKEVRLGEGRMLCDEQLN
jgi:hypothetical protein